MNTRSFVKFILPLILVVLVTAFSSVVTALLFKKCPSRHQDTHAWIHEQLELTPEQDKALAASEAKFKAQQKDLAERIRLANMELGQALVEDAAYSPRVNAALEKIHTAQGELQKATLEHVFEMQPILSLEQYRRLLNLTANALYTTP